MNTWYRAIDRATTEAEVVAQTRDFLSLVNPRDLACLPEDLRAVHVDKDTDIALWRERLQQGCAGTLAEEHDAVRVREMLSYLSRASERLDQIRATH